MKALKASKALTALLALGLMATTAGSAAAATGTTIHIKPRTSPIFLYDTSGEGTFERAVTAPATVVDCVPGETYQMDGFLIQNGIAHPWTVSGGLGAGEYWCDEQGRFELGGLPFAGEDLRPGRAVVQYAVRLCCDGDDVPEATAERTVRIPRDRPRY